MPVVPSALRTTSFTVNVPGFEKVIVGFWIFDSAPFPKSQFQNCGLPVVRSLKLTTNGAQPEVWLAVNSGTIVCVYPFNENNRRNGKHIQTENSFPGLPLENRTGKRIRLPQSASTNLLKATFFMVVLGTRPHCTERPLLHANLVPGNCQRFCTAQMISS